MAKRPVPLYDFKAFGAAIKAARKEYGESRKTVSDALYISPRYLANIENKGQGPGGRENALYRIVPPTPAPGLRSGRCPARPAGQS